MKKNSIIFSAVIITLSLTAFGIINKNEPETNTIETIEKKDVAIQMSSEAQNGPKLFTDFIYEVAPRFTPIKKRDLDTIRSFNDIIGEEHANRIVKYQSVSVIIMREDKLSDVREAGNSDVFTKSQLELLQTSPYSTNLTIWADYHAKNKETGVLEDTHWTPYLTIVPEKQATFSKGKDALKKFLREKSLEARTVSDVTPERLRPAKLFFTITKNGTIENVKLDRTSNFPLVDETMMKLIKETSKLWIPAENYKGEKVDQELVVSFGLIGC